MKKSQIKPATIYQRKLQNLRNFIFNRYGVYTFSKLKDKLSKQELIEFRRLALLNAGFKHKKG